MFAGLKEVLIQMINTESMKNNLGRTFHKKTALKILTRYCFVILIDVTQNIFHLKYKNTEGFNGFLTKKYKNVG